MPVGLTQTNVGEQVKIIEIEGGDGLRQKLFLRGLIEGKVIRIVSNYGPVTVEVERNTIAIGRGMAQRIAVERC